MESSHRRWIIMDTADDVATALMNLSAGTGVEDLDRQVHVQLRKDIPFGHKFAIRAIPKGGRVHKYGQVIGSAISDIEPGDHVHVHNVESLRGRGDLPNPQTPPSSTQEEAASQ
ncbi:D-galactarate dehydratase [Alicyclobacillaceae bacterium I2511]|nr:D-galactarate dehydratase [Alicyclobacillaceae bacterium I2511]